MNDVVEFLKNYIWQNGFKKLSENPFDVYKAMVKSDKNKHGIDQRKARLVLITLMSKTHEMAKNGYSADGLIRKGNINESDDKKHFNDSYGRGHSVGFIRLWL